MPPVVENPLFFLDYDGTLAPIVDDPDKAVPHVEAPALLRQLDGRYPVWIVTGRHLRSLSAFLDQPLNAIGLHGAQTGIIGERAELLMSDRAARALRRLRRTVPSIEGVRVEEKDHSFAVHYRHAEDKRNVQERLKEWLDSLPDILDAIWGKCVVELRPEGLTKGTAVRKITQDYPDSIPVYIGDDVTDEDAFEALQSREGASITIKVGEAETCAKYQLADPDAVVDYLKQYV